MNDIDKKKKKPLYFVLYVSAEHSLSQQVTIMQFIYPTGYHKD